MEETIQVQQPAPPSAGRAVLKRRAEGFFKSLWASLFYSGRVVGKSVMVSSANSGEGATTVACGLALAGSSPSAADKVALVDLNLHRPHVHRMLRLEMGVGVSEIVLEGAEAATAARKVNPMLDVYTAGAAGGRALDVLRNEALQRFVDYLCGAYAYVLVDVAAVNQYPDGQVLARILKDVVLVAHTERTPREAVAEAKKRLEASGGRIAGVVLNLRTYPIPRFLYRRV